MPTAKRLSSMGLYPKGRHRLAASHRARRPCGYNFLQFPFWLHCTTHRGLSQNETACVPILGSLTKFRPIVFDGKAIKNVAKRLLPFRDASGLLGGRTLVALDVRPGLVLAMHGHPDGDANDTRFVGDLVPYWRRTGTGDSSGLSIVGSTT